MKTAIIKSSLFTKTKWLRLDAGYYLGTIEAVAFDIAISIAEKRLDNAKVRLENLKARKKDSQNRINDYIRNGDMERIN